MKRINITTGAPWEKAVGYCRAVRIGDIVEVSGTVAVKDGKVVGAGDPYMQAKYIFEIIEKALNDAGAKITDVVRTRMYITDVAWFESVGKAHGEVFHDIMPATSMIVIKGLVSDDYLVEIEATARISDQ